MDHHLTLNFAPATKVASPVEHSPVSDGQQRTRTTLLHPTQQPKTKSVSSTSAGVQEKRLSGPNWRGEKGSAALVAR